MYLTIVGKTGDTLQPWWSATRRYDLTGGLVGTTCIVHHPYVQIQIAPLYLNLQTETGSIAAALVGVHYWFNPFSCFACILYVCNFFKSLNFTLRPK